MGIFRPDPTCPHGKPLQVSCHKCTQPQRDRAIGKASGKSGATSKGVDPRTRTSGTYKTGIFGGTRKTNRHAR